jgi:hypothetical protein
MMEPLMFEDMTSLITGSAAFTTAGPAMKSATAAAAIIGVNVVLMKLLLNERMSELSVSMCRVSQGFTTAAILYHYTIRLTGTLGQFFFEVPICRFPRAPEKLGKKAARHRRAASHIVCCRDIKARKTYAGYP